jgi:hypothetical protein
LPMDSWIKRWCLVDMGGRMAIWTDTLFAHFARNHQESQTCATDRAFMCSGRRRRGSTPLAMPSMTDPQPACVTNAPTAACRSTATCGAHGTTSPVHDAIEELRREERPRLLLQGPQERRAPGFQPRREPGSARRRPADPGPGRH